MTKHRGDSSRNSRRQRCRKGFLSISRSWIDNFNRPQKYEIIRPFGKDSAYKSTSEKGTRCGNSSGKIKISAGFRIFVPLFPITLRNRPVPSERSGTIRFYGKCLSGPNTYRNEKVTSDLSADRRLECAGPRSISALRRLALLVPLRKQQRQRPLCHAAAHLEPRCTGRDDPIPAHDRRLSAQTLRTADLDRKAALPEILRRGERRPPLRKRNLRRRAPGRNDRFRLRNHRPGEIRQRKPASRSREQRHYGRRAAALVHPQHLRRHQPGGRTHRHRPHRRIASVSGLVGSPDPPSGRIDRTGRSRGRNPPHLERRQLLPRDPRSVRSGRNSGRSQNDKGQTRRQTRRHPLHGRKSPTVGPRSPQPLSNAGIRRERHLAR